MEAEKNFYNWIVEMAEDPTDDPAGDFILDADADNEFPRDAEADEHGFVTIMNYLYFNKRVWNGVLDAFMDAWQWYYRDITGTDWADASYNNYMESEAEQI